MTLLSVNVNKIATLRNSRGGNVPNLIEVVKDIERFGAQGITVHPRPDERHITGKDAYEVAEVVNTEYNIEGYPNERFLKMIREIRPTQATLVPDGPDVLTSNAGWDTIRNKELLQKIVGEIKSYGVRVSIFIDPDDEMIKHAKDTGTDRIELYTEAYASGFLNNSERAIEPYVNAAKVANEVGLGINAGHDLNLENLRYFHQNIKGLMEVSIGHALISDALYFGLENTVNLYLRELRDEVAL